MERLIMKNSLRERETPFNDLSVQSNFTLTALVEYLTQLPSQQFNVAKLVALFSRLKVTDQEINKLINYSPDNYTRNLFFKCDRFEVIVMGWNGYQQSPIHDHAQSFSVEYIYSGRIINTNYHSIAPESTSVYQGASETISHGQVIYGLPGEIHRIVNPDATPATSIHLYAPPLTHIQCFNEPGDIAQLMTLGYFSQ